MAPSPGSASRPSEPCGQTAKPTPITDDDRLVLLARLARTVPHLAHAALDALEVIDHPRATQLLTGLAQRRHS